jgi:pimeloyl-ACP methyl ester carboxylesterase
MGMFSEITAWWTGRRVMPAAAEVSRFYKQLPSGETSRLIVFVHGVLGGAPTTWGRPESDNFWPSLVESDPRFADFDIYLVNYLTRFVGRSPNIYETANSELNYLEDRGVFSRYREVHFIAHSMGGLIVKRMLVRLRDRDEVTKLRRIKSVVCLSTPAQGAGIATVASWFSNNPQFSGLTPAHVNESIQELEDAWVQLLRARDREGTPFPEVHCAYETLAMDGVIVVPREMANTRCDSDLHPMPYDHSGMASARGRDVDPYLWAMARTFDASQDVAERESLWIGQFRPINV